MKRIYKLLLASSLLITTSAFSSPQNKPVVCPSVASIIAEGLDYAEKDSHLFEAWMVAKLKSKYDTSDEWTFITFVGKSNENATAALEAGTKIIATLSLSEGPMAGHVDGQSECIYESTLNPFFGGVAFNPPLDPASAPTKFSQILQMRR